MSEERAGAGEGPDVTPEKSRDDANPHKVEDLTKAGRNEFDPNAETEGGEDESSTEKDGDDSHLHEDQKSKRLDT